MSYLWVTPYNQLPKLADNMDGIIVDHEGAWWVSKHVRYNEIACKCGRAGCRDINWAKVIHPATLALFEDVRRVCCEMADKEVPIIINSGCRCYQHQNDLTEKGYYTGYPSPHAPTLQVTGIYQAFALDLTIPPVIGGRGLHDAIRAVSKDAGIGLKVYNYTLCHIDMAQLCAVQTHALPPEIAREYLKWKPNGREW